MFIGSCCMAIDFIVIPGLQGSQNAAIGLRFLMPKRSFPAFPRDIFGRRFLCRPHIDKASTHQLWPGPDFLGPHIGWVYHPFGCLDGTRSSHMFLDRQVPVFKGKTALISVDNQNLVAKTPPNPCLPTKPSIYDGWRQLLLVPYFKHLQHVSKDIRIQIQNTYSR